MNNKKLSNQLRQIIEQRYEDNNGYIENDILTVNEHLHAYPFI